MRSFGWVEVCLEHGLQLIWSDSQKLWTQSQTSLHLNHFYSGTSLGLTPRWTWPPFKAWTKSSTMLNRWIFCKAYVFVRLVFEFQASVLDFSVVFFVLRCQYLKKGCATSKNGTGLLLTSTSIASTSQRWELGRWLGCWLMLIKVMPSLTFNTRVSSLDIHKGWRKDWWSKWSWWWWKAHWLLQPYQDGKLFFTCSQKMTMKMKK